MSKEWYINGILDNYTIEQNAYRGVDFSRVGFLYCGQGQMVKGVMHDMVTSNPLFVARLQELDEVTRALFGQAASVYLLDPKKKFTGEEESLYSCLCLLTLQTAMFEFAVSKGYIPCVVSGHSFGEYSSLVTSGLVSFADMINVLYRRHLAIQETINEKFSMFAISGKRNVDFSDMESQIELANINTPFQSTYVCRESDFEMIRKELRSRKVPVVPVDVAFPFHTSWMQSASQRLKESIKDLDVGPSKIAMVSSVTGEWIPPGVVESDRVIDLISNQLINKVDFPGQLNSLLDHRVQHFFELSPTDVLSDMVDQTMRTSGQAFKVHSFRKQFSNFKVANKSYDRFKSSKLFSALDGALRSLTGYGVANIQLEDRIREDLGIDSIKKAEIVFEIAESMNDVSELAPKNLAELTSFGDILEFIEASQSAENSSSQSGESGASFHVVQAVNEEQSLIDYQKIDVSRIKVIRDWELEAWNVSSAIDFAESYLKLSDFEFTHLVLLHSGTPRARSLMAFFTSYCIEKGMAFKFIQCAPSDEKAISFQLECSDFRNAHVKYSDGVRSIVEYQPVKPTQGQRRPYQHMIVFGGLGGVGREIIHSFDRKPPQKITIIGKSSLGSVEKKLARLKSDLKTSEIEYFSFDIARLEDLRELINTIELQQGKADLIVHSVGVEVSVTADLTSRFMVEQVVTAKFLLAEYLADLAQQRPETQFIFNSSVASDFPSLGQSAYALVNGYLNGLAEWSQNIVSICWPAWKEVGVTTKSLNEKSLRLQGTALLESEEGRKIFQRLLERDRGTFIVLPEGDQGLAAQESWCRVIAERLLTPASRDRSIMAVPGLSQKEMPYLKDHLVQRACIFPGSGSLALMLLRVYVRTGQLANLRNFQAINFHVVPSEKSNLKVKMRSEDSKTWSLSVNSHQVIAQCEAELTAKKEEAPSWKNISTEVVAVTDFDQNVSVYTGPDFLLSDKTFINKKDDLHLLELNLRTAPKYHPCGFFDKIHRILEFLFSAAHSRAIHDYSLLTVPKSFEALEFYPENLNGEVFYSVTTGMKKSHRSFKLDIYLVNSRGQVAVAVKQLIKVSVGSQSTHKTKGFKERKEQNSFFVV